MDGSRFDALARAAARSASRRALLGTALGGLVAATLDRAAEAAFRARPLDAVCLKNADCVSGVCGPKDATGRRRCQCGGPADCPGSTNPCSVAVCTPSGCGFAPGNAGAVCGSVVDACSAAPVCTGSALDCPPAAPSACPVGESCCDGACASLFFDSNNCVTCGVVCPAGQICSGGCCIAIYSACDPAGPDLCCGTGVCGANSQCCQPTGLPCGINITGPTGYCCSGYCNAGTCAAAP